MPSGAKRRKSAKKKKENQNQTESNNHSDSVSTPAHPHGEDDRDSDVVEVSSPMSQDHHKPPTEGKNGDIENGSEVTDPSYVTLVEKEIKIKDELGEKDGIINRSDGTRSSGGSSSSSDDESHEIKNEETASSIASLGSSKVADSLSEKPVELVCDSSIVEDDDSEKIIVTSERVHLNVLPLSDIAVIEPTLNENGKKKCCSVKERTSSLNASSPGKEATAQSAKSTPKTIDQKECVNQKNGDRSISPYIDNEPQHTKDSVVTQPASAAPPFPVQKTSWKGCCGLFEVFSSSGAN